MRLSPLRVHALLAAVLFLSAFPARSQTIEVFEIGTDTIESVIEWQLQVMRITVSRPVPRGGNAPAAVARTQSAIRRDAPPLIAQSLLPLQLTSTHTIESAVQAASRTSALMQIAGMARPVDASSDPQLERASVTFELDLYPAISELLNRSEEREDLPERVGWTASGEYTGVVIYARGDLPLFGTDQELSIQPALLPSIRFLDEDEREVRVLVEQTMMTRETLRTTGPLLYHTELTAPAVRERTGDNPMRIVAVGSFGIAPVDPVIQFEDAVELLADENNRALLRDGRIVVIVSSESL